MCDENVILPYPLRIRSKVLHVLLNYFLGDLIKRRRGRLVGIVLGT